MKFNDLIFYEIYPTSFKDSNNDGIGDLNGITEKLDYVKDLGCNAIWLNPMYKSPFKDGGYDIENFFEVDERFGTLDDFKALIEKAHKLGIKVILDLVIGHASFQNKEFLMSAEPFKNEYSDLFIWNDLVWILEDGYRLISGMYQRNGCYMVNFFAHQPAFNYGFKEVKYPWQKSYKDPVTFKARDYMLKVMRYWLSLGADGFRVDMADSLVKDDEDKSATIEVWHYLFENIRKEFPDAFFVSEWSYPDRAFRAGFDADFVLDHQNNFYHHLARMEEYSNEKSCIHGGDLKLFISDLTERLNDAKKYHKLLANISGNHDSFRVANYLNEKELKLFYMFLFSIPGVPFIYYGDEIAMTSPDLPSKDGGFQRTGSRTPMQWDLSKNMGFSTTDRALYLPINEDNKVSVLGMNLNKDSVYHFIKRLIEVRKAFDDLRSEEFEIKENNRVIEIIRGKIKLIMNLSNKEIKIDKTIISTNQFDKLGPAEAALVRIE